MYNTPDMTFAGKECVEKLRHSYKYFPESASACDKQAELIKEELSKKIDDIAKELAIFGRCCIVQNGIILDPEHYTITKILS